MTTSTKEPSYILENYELDEVLSTIQTNGLLLFPTDTLWSIGCDATNEEAIERLLCLKKMEEAYTYEILVDSLEMLKEYVPRLHPRLETLLSFHNRPLTIIHDKVKNLPAKLMEADGSIAIRVVRDVFCKMIIQRTGKPLVSTHANFEEDDFPPYFGAVSSAVIQKVDYVVKFRQTEKRSGEPSVMVRMEADDELIFLRE